jgi:hypothetical protein
MYVDYKNELKSVWKFPCIITSFIYCCKCKKSWQQTIYRTQTIELINDIIKLKLFPKVKYFLYCSLYIFIGINM